MQRGCCLIFCIFIVMPLYREWNPDIHSLAAIWRMDETESFFTAQLPVSAEEIRNDTRRLERLAGRFLLQYLKNDFPLHAIAPDEHDKPQIPGNQYHFSVTHSFPYVAAIVSTDAPVGIDLQCWHASILKLQHKFLTPEEQLFTGDDPQAITLAWCAKEAAYKYQGKRGVEFRDHLVMEHWAKQGSVYDIKIDLRLTEPFRNIELKGFIYDDFALSLTCGYSH